ncbi:creatininase family protein [Salinisphaera sp.]|uniref:creatininase family protein n=1 Tax=Salinisphaera sp. TaxID=1914330 RepID=UPI000C393CD8|nr:creatininase family protein [Salinisphaera sp.]MAS09135.1 creatininase [Salinisphaera sp.]
MTGREDERRDDVFAWADLTGPELAALAAADPVAILPVAAIEQHGPHLPLSTDVDIGHGLIDAALAGGSPGQRPVLRLPGLAIGSSMEHAYFAGTLSLSPEQAIAQIEAIGAAVARAGIRRLLLFNSHGGNKAVLDMAALKLRAAHGLLVVKANYFRFTPPADSLSARELAHGLHGGALETSLMLHFAPEKIRRDKLATFEPLGQRRADDGATLLPEGDAAFAWLAQDLHPAGVAGDARKASAAHGATLCAHFAARLRVIIDETLAFDLDTLGAR